MIIKSENAPKRQAFEFFYAIQEAEEQPWSETKTKQNKKKREREALEFYQPDSWLHFSYTWTTQNKLAYYKVCMFETEDEVILFTVTTSKECRIQNKHDILTLIFPLQ